MHCNKVALMFAVTTKLLEVKFSVKSLRIGKTRNSLEKAERAQLMAFHQRDADVAGSTHNM